MTSIEAQYLLELWDKHICSFCGKKIPGGKYFGGGEKMEAGFCSLGCYDNDHRVEIIERAKMVQALAERHRNS